MGAAQFQNIKISAGNPYRNLAFEDPNGDGMRKAQAYEVQMGGSYSGPNNRPGPGAFGTGDPGKLWVPGWTQDTPAAAPASAQVGAASGVSGQLADLIAKPAAGGGGPSGPGANPFTDQMNQYLSSSAPATPGQASLAPNRFAGGLTAAEQRLQDLISNPEALQNSSSYKFRVQQGQQALERSLGARGLLQSGNRLSELTKYGQDMGSQEYEAENARRMGLFNSYAGNYNTDQANNVNLLGVQQGSLDKQYATAADLFKTRGATIANLYGGADTANTARYGIDTTAGTARANTLADLYRTDQATALGYQQDRTKQLDWAYKSQIEQANALAKAQQAMGRRAPNPGFTTEQWWNTGGA